MLMVEDAAGDGRALPADLSPSPGREVGAEATLAEAHSAVQHEAPGAPRGEEARRLRETVLEALAEVHEKDDQLLALQRNVQALRRENLALRVFIPTNDETQPLWDFLDNDQSRRQSNDVSGRVDQEEARRLRLLEKQVAALRWQNDQMQRFIKQDEEEWIRRTFIEDGLLREWEREVDECELVEYMQAELAQSRTEVESLQHAMVQLAAQYRVSAKEHASTLAKLKHIEEFFGAAFDACHTRPGRTPRLTPRQTELRTSGEYACARRLYTTELAANTGALTPRGLSSTQKHTSSMTDVTKGWGAAESPTPRRGLLPWACDTAFAATVQGSRLAFRITCAVMPTFPLRIAQRLLQFLPTETKADENDVKLPLKPLPDIPKLRLKEYVFTGQD